MVRRGTHNTRTYARPKSNMVIAFTAQLSSINGLHAVGDGSQLTHTDK